MLIRPKLKGLLLIRLMCVWLMMFASVHAQDLAEAFADVRILTENYPPLNYVEEGELKGASFEILKLVYDELGLPMPEVEVMPWPRAYAIAQQDDPVMLFTMSRTDARESLFQWAGHTHASRTYLVTYEGSGIETYDPAEQQDRMVLAIRTDVTQYVMEELGYPTDKLFLVDSNEAMFRAISKERLAMMSVADSPFKSMQERDEFKDIPFVVLATTRESQGHFAFSHGVDPDVVAAFQKALENVRAEQKEILKRYGMNY